MSDEKSRTMVIEPDALGLAQADLTERVAEAMRSVSRAYVAAVVSALAEKGFEGLTPASVALLAQIPKDGAQTVVLARQTRRTKQATGKVVAELEANGYAERHSDPADGRGQIVRLTQKGGEALLIGAAAKVALAERAFSVLNAEELQRLHADLARLEVVMTGSSTGSAS